MVSSLILVSRPGVRRTFLRQTAISADAIGRAGRRTGLLLKDNANYRQLRDRQWPTTMDLAAITIFIPTSYASLGAPKSELEVGLASLAS